MSPNPDHSLPGLMPVGVFGAEQDKDCRQDPSSGWEPKQGADPAGAEMRGRAFKPGRTVSARGYQLTDQSRREEASEAELDTGVYSVESGEPELRVMDPSWRRDIPHVSSPWASGAPDPEPPTSEEAEEAL